MKRAKEIKVGNRTYTQIQCLNYGATTNVPGRIAAKAARTAIQRECRQINASLKLVNYELRPGRLGSRLAPSRKPVQPVARPFGAAAPCSQGLPRSALAITAAHGRS